MESSNWGFLKHCINICIPSQPFVYFCTVYLCVSQPNRRPWSYRLWYLDCLIILLARFPCSLPLFFFILWIKGPGCYPIIADILLIRVVVNCVVLSLLTFRRLLVRTVLWGWNKKWYQDGNMEWVWNFILNTMC